MSLKLLIDSKRQRVVFAEADQKAIDFLSHALTFPLPTLLSLVDDERKMPGCIGNLFQRDVTEENYEALVNPKTPVGYTCNCNNGGHSYFSDAASVICPECSEIMSVKMTYVAPPPAAKGSATAGTYMVMDDLVVKPLLSAVSAFATLSKLNVQADFATLEEKVVHFGLYEALEVVQTSLSRSNKVLTTVFLKNEEKINLKAMVVGLWSNDESTQLDSISRITNMLSTDEGNQKVIDHGAVPRLVKLLGSPSHDVRKQVVCALGHIAVDSHALVLSHGALAPLLAQFDDGNAELTALRDATRVLCKICRSGLKYDQLRLALPVLGKVLTSSTDEKVLSNTCSTLSRLSEYCTDDKIQAVIDSRVCPRLIQLLEHPSPKVLLPALDTIGNIIVCGGYYTQAQDILGNDFALSHLRNLLEGDYNADIKKDACWKVSKITAGRWDHIWVVINSGVSSALIDLLQNAESIEIKEMAAKAISNAICGNGTRNQIRRLVKQGCIKPMCDLLVCPDPGIVTPCLESLKKIVNVDLPEYVHQMIIDAGGLKNLLKIQKHDDSGIRKMAKFIISKVSK